MMSNFQCEEWANLMSGYGHVVFRHDYKMSKVSFTALDRVHIPDRGGDWNKTLLQWEQRWIFRLLASTYPSLNESISFAPFLQGFASD